MSLIVNIGFKTSYECLVNSRKVANPKLMNLLKKRFDQNAEREKKIN